MTPPFDWDDCYRRFRKGNAYDTAEALNRLSFPTDANADWLIESLTNERRWFVGYHAMRARGLAEIFFRPLMDAGIDECEPSGCRPYICSCAGMFGVRRTLEYLYDVIDKENDRRKVGALLAIYMAVPVSAAASMKRAVTGESDPEVDDRQFVLLKERERELVLRTYLGSSDRLVRLAALRRLPLELNRYPEHLRPLVHQVIEDAKRSKDKFTRALVEHKLNPHPTTFPDTWPRGLLRGSGEPGP